VFKQGYDVAVDSILQVVIGAHKKVSAYRYFYQSWASHAWI